MKRLMFLLLILRCLPACQAADKEATAKPDSTAIQAHDFLGRRIQLERPPQRIISLAPNVTELIYALHADSLLIGVTEYCNYPPPAKTKPIMGGFAEANLNLEAILAAKPDLVIATPTQITPMVERFDALKIPFYAFAPQNIPQLLDGFRQVGDLLDRSEAARMLADSLQTQVDRLKAACAQTPHQRVFLEISANPLMSANNTTIVSQLLELAGGQNICGDLAEAYPTVTAEFILAQNPEVIIIAHSGTTVNEIATRPGWSHLPAVRTQTICLDLDQDVIFRAGPRLIEGALAFRHCLE